MNRVVTKLTLLAAVCGLLLGLANATTHDTIADNREQLAARQLLSVAGHEGEIEEVASERYVLRKNGELSGWIFPVTTGNGYNGRIDLWLGVASNGEVTGVRVNSHEETPGLGDKIELAVTDWILSFNGRTLDGTRWDVRKHGGDFDAFSGATITPRAVVHAVRDGLARFENEHEEWQDEL